MLAFVFFFLAKDMLPWVQTIRTLKVVHVLNMVQ